MKKKYICFLSGEAQIIEKKSRFIANVFPIQNEEEALTYIESIKKKFWDARHHCYAYIHADGKISRCSDDGEPSGTAGKPMLEILQNKNIQGICVIVTRYFGGILLGTGGLVRAYQSATLIGLENASIYELEEGYLSDYIISYEEYGKFNYLCEKYKLPRISIDYTEQIFLQLILPIDIHSIFIAKIQEESAGKILPIKEEKVKYIIHNQKVEIL